jgi:hypothetical protein
MYAFFTSLVCVAVVVGLLAVVLRAIRQSVRDFPPISDEEFMALCKPGTSPEVALKVRRIVANYSGIEYARVSPMMNFIEDLA